MIRFEEELADRSPDGGTLAFGAASCARAVSIAHQTGGELSHDGDGVA